MPARKAKPEQVDAWAKAYEWARAMSMLLGEPSDGAMQVEEEKWRHLHDFRRSQLTATKEDD